MDPELSNRKKSPSNTNKNLRENLTPEGLSLGEMEDYLKLQTDE
jgi:hypothetical protein